MSGDVSVSSFIITVDVVHSNFDQQAFLEHGKSARKKQFFVFTANDTTDAGRQSRNDKARPNQYQNSEPVIKDLKTKVDGELHRLLDAKKRQIALDQKRQAKLQNDKGARRSLSPRQSQKSLTELPLAYQGQAEVVFCINSFPNRPGQLQTMLSSGVNLGAFISIIRPNDPVVGQPSPVKEATRPRSRSRKRSIREPVEVEVIQQIPPARWTNLKLTADESVVFLEIRAPVSIEETWEIFEREIGRIIQSRNDFVDRFNGRHFVIIPTAEAKPDISNLRALMKRLPDNPLAAILSELQQNEWTVKGPEVAHSLMDIYKNAFRDISRKLQRDKIIEDTKELPKLFDTSYYRGFDTFYNVKKWQMNEETAAVTKAVAMFYMNSFNFHAAAGHRFDTMVSQANKRHFLGLSLTYFDWTKWKYSKEIEFAPAEMEKVLEDYLVVDSFLEDPVGILWILALPAIGRVIGQPFEKFYMPPLLDGASDWLNMFDHEAPPERKGRFVQTPAQMVKNKENLEALLPNFITRLSHEGQDIYRVPLKLGNCTEHTSPFFFKTGLRVFVKRALVNTEPEFTYKLLFASGAEIESSVNSMMFAMNGVRVLFEYPRITIYTPEGYSICVDNGKIMFQIDDRKMMLVNNGTVILRESKYTTVVMADGHIGRCNQGMWTWTDTNGKGFQKYMEEIKVIEQKQQVLTDFETNVTSVLREDAVKFFVHENGSRVIECENLVINHNVDGECCFKHSKLQPISFQNGEYTINVGDFIFACNLDNGTFDIRHSTIKAQFAGKDLCFAIDGDMGSITPYLLQIRSNDTVLYAHKNGVQRIGPLLPDDLPPKRREEVVMSKWGRIGQIKESRSEEEQIELQKMFIPRFFAIRRDLSATEFVHEHRLEQFVKKNIEIEDINGEPVRLATFHSPSGFNEVFVETEPLDKQQRAQHLHKLQIPKQRRTVHRTKRGQPQEDPQIVINEGKEASTALLNAFELIRTRGNEAKAKNHQEYLDEITPKPPPPPERLVPPVFTPDPRLLMAQAMKNTSADEHNYWESPEATFAMPLDEPRSLPKPLSPRVQLFDLPRDKKMKFDPPPEEPKPVVKKPDLKSPRRTGRVYNTEVSRPQTADSTPRHIDFGLVNVGETATETIEVLNTTSKPIHYSFSKPDHPDVQVLTLPGVFMPGLTLRIRVSLCSKTPQGIGTSFILRTSQGDTVIPVYATIVE